MTSYKSIAHNFLTLGSGEIISRLISFGAIIYIVRVLGANGYGVIAFALGVNLYMSKVADFAIESVGIKEISTNRESFIPLASAIMGTRLALAIMIMLTTILLVQLILPQPDKSILSLYLLTMIPIAMNSKWIHMGIEDARPVSISRVIGETLGLSIVLVIMTQASRLWVPPTAMIASETLSTILLFIFLWKKGHQLKFTLDIRKTYPVFRKALPVLIHVLLGLLVYNSDLIFLRYFHTSEYVGYYAAAYTLVGFLSNMGLSYRMSLLPVFSRHQAGSIEEKKLYQTSIAHVYTFCFPIAIGGFMLAQPIIELGFGNQYENSVIALQILIWSIPFSVFRNLPYIALIAREQQTKLIAAIFYAAIINLILNLVLIPEYGIAGAAIATVITEFLVSFLLQRYVLKSGLPFIPLIKLWRQTASGLGMGLSIFWLQTSWLFVDIFLGIAAYAIGMILTGGIQFNNGKPTIKVQ